MAAPYVSGIAALILSANPDLTGSEVRTLVMNTSVPLDSLNSKTVSGGMANAYNAVRAAKTSVNKVPATSFVTRFYQLCLGRAPDAAGLDFWVHLLLTGQSAGADVASGFVLSDEFKNRSIDDEAYVTIMYQAFFDRDPDVDGFNGWLATLENGMSRYSVLAGFVNSEEFKALAVSFEINPGRLVLVLPADLYPQITAFVTRFYRLCLERNPDADGLNVWVKNLKSNKSTGADVTFGFVFSLEC